MKKLSRTEYAHEVALVAAVMQDLVGAKLYRQEGSWIGGVECWALIAFWARGFVDHNLAAKTDWEAIGDKGGKALSKKYKAGNGRYWTWDECIEDYALWMLDKIRRH